MIFSLEYYKGIYNAIMAQDAGLAFPRDIAKKLATVQLYELKGVDALHPEVKEKCQSLIATMISRGMEINIVSTIRTAKAQDDLYAQGRTTAGNIVTNAKGLQSYHNFGVAFDVCFKVHGYNPPTGWWETLGKEGEKLGLEWGGRWAEFKDQSHFEYHPYGIWQALEKFFKN